MGGIYDHALLCDIAFEFRDLGREVAGIESCIREHSRIAVRSLLDVGCGTSPHLPGLAKLGLSYTGLDNSAAMLEFGRRRAAELGIAAEFVEAGLSGFSLRSPRDFAFCAMNSLYLSGPAEAASHLSCMAAALRPGGIYLLDWCVLSVPLVPGERRWERERDGVRVRASVTWGNVDAAGGLFDETVVFEADENGKPVTVRTTTRRWAPYADVFLRLVRESGAFDHVGWWDDWDLSRPVSHPEGAVRPLVALRRRHDAPAGRV